MIVASTQRAIGFVVLAIVAVGFVVWLFVNLRSSSKEVGSEIELAANRKPYLDDDELEGKKLNLALFSAAGLLAVIGVALPLYWLAEPGRMDGAIETFDETFAERGLELYEVGAQCVNCHGGNGSGGQATFIINDQNGVFVDQVSWNAPALNNVLYRYSEEEVRYILNFGRPGTPMAAWGGPGGGPLTTQQIDNLIDYLWSIQLEPKDMIEEVDGLVQSIDEGLYERMLEVRSANEGDIEAVDAERLSTEDEIKLGEILFNNQELGAGAYSCARCHIPGAAYDRRGDTFEQLPYSSFGPNLEGVENQATEQQHFDLIWNGMEEGQLYFSRKQGNPQMPGFGANPNTGQTDLGIPDKGEAGMLQPEQVWAIVTYERNLLNGASFQGPTAGTDESPTFSGQSDE